MHDFRPPNAGASAARPRNLTKKPAHGESAASDSLGPRCRLVYWGNWRPKCGSGQQEHSQLIPQYLFPIGARQRSPDVIVVRLYSQGLIMVLKGISCRSFKLQVLVQTKDGMASQEKYRCRKEYAGQ